MSTASVTELIQLRDAGHVRIAAVRTHPNDGLADTLFRLGVHYEGERCREVEGEEARRILASAFHKDLAYGAELMPKSEAERLAAFVVGEIFPPRAKFLTNVDVLDPVTMFQGNYAAFFNGTAATFSVGVIAVAPSITACAWFEDED